MKANEPTVRDVRCDVSRPCLSSGGDIEPRPVRTPPSNARRHDARRLVLWPEAFRLTDDAAARRDDARSFRGSRTPRARAGSRRARGSTTMSWDATSTPGGDTDVGAAPAARGWRARSHPRRGRREQTRGRLDRDAAKVFAWSRIRDPSARNEVFQVVRSSAPGPEVRERCELGAKMSRHVAVKFASGELRGSLDC